MIQYYNIKENASILYIGCGKGFILYEFKKLLPKEGLVGIDISGYAVENAKDEIKDCIQLGTATSLPFKDNQFDYAYSLGCLHNLFNYELYDALKELERVGNGPKYTMQEFYRTDAERINLCNWQLPSIHFLVCKNGSGL